MGDQTPHDEALRRAEQEGLFKGQILTSLEDIKRVLGEMNLKHTTQDVKIEQKADKKDHDGLVQDVKAIQRLVYIGLGILGAVEFLIIALK